MAATASRPTVIYADLRWNDIDGVHRVIDIDRQGRQFVILRPDGEEDLMDVVSTYRHLSHAAGEGPNGMATIDLDQAWSGIDPVERARLERRAQDLTLMATGDPYGDLKSGRPRPGVTPDPDFDPLALDPDTGKPRNPESVRVQRMSHRLRASGEKGAKHRNLRLQLSKIKRVGGARNLINGNSLVERTTLVTDAPAELRDAAQAFVKSRDDTKSKVEKKVLLDLFKIEVDGADYLDEDVPDSMIKAVFDDALKGAKILASAESRRSINARPTQKGGLWYSPAPYWAVQIDASEVDCHARDQYGRWLDRITILTAVDVYTHRILAIRFAPIDYTSQDVQLLLWDIVAGNYYHPDEHLLGGRRCAPHLPERAIIPEVLIIDRGSQFNSAATLAAAAGVHMSVVISPPGRGSRKPHVESKYKTVNSLIQAFPAYKGNRSINRGRKVEEHPSLFLQDLLDLLWIYVETVIHNTPQDSLRHPSLPGVAITPNQMEDMFFVDGGRLTVDHDPHRALMLMKKEWRVVNDDGIEWATNKYWHPELDDLRDKTQGGGGDKQSRHPIWVDPAWPDDIITRNSSGAVVVVPRKGSREPRMPFADLLERRYRDMLDLGGAVDRRELGVLGRAIIKLAKDLAAAPLKARGRFRRDDSPPAEVEQRTRPAPTPTVNDSFSAQLNKRRGRSAS